MPQPQPQPESKSQPQATKQDFESPLEFVLPVLKKARTLAKQVRQFFLTRDPSSRALTQSPAV